MVRPTTEQTLYGSALYQFARGLTEEEVAFHLEETHGYATPRQREEAIQQARLSWSAAQVAGNTIAVGLADQSLEELLLGAGVGVIPGQRVEVEVRYEWEGTNRQGQPITEAYTVYLTLQPDQQLSELLALAGQELAETWTPPVGLPIDPIPVIVGIRPV